MADYNSRARVTLSVNGRQASDMLNKLKAEAVTLKQKIDAAAKAGDKATVDKLNRQLRQTNSVIDQITNGTRNMDNTLRNLDTATPKELKKTLQQLQRNLDGIARGSKAWDEQMEKIQRVRAALKEVNDEMREMENQETFVEKLQSMWERFSVSIVAVAGAFTGLVTMARNAYKQYADMDQEMANVRKYTGMTEGQVNELNEAFKKIDTRSSREELNMLAEEAGRLGKNSVEDVLGYVRAANQINVALDDLGENATLTISKLTGIFGDEKRLGTEQSMLAVGSAINDLSQNCTASAPYLAEFASRMGGVASQAGLTIPQIVAFGAVLDSNNQKVEASATAISQILTRMFADPAKYAREIGMNVTEFANLLKNDANEALMRFLEALNKAGNMDTLAPMFKNMGENGSRAISAMATLAKHVDEVRLQQEQAKKSFEEAVSITAEYNVQNETLNAKLDKASNKMKEVQIELGEKLAPAMAVVVSKTSLLVKGISTTVDFIIRNKTVLAELVVGIIAYTVAVNAAAIKTKLLMVEQVLLTTATKAAGVAQLAWNAIVAICTGNVQKLRVQIRALNLLMKTNPWGLAAAAITAVVVAATKLIQTFREAGNAQKELNEIERSAGERMADTTVKIDLLRKAAENENLQLNERKRAIAQLNAIIPNYNAQIDQTTGKYTASAVALKEYNKQLRKKYELEGARQALTKLSEQKANIMTDDSYQDKAKRTMGAMALLTYPYGGAANNAMNLMTDKPAKALGEKMRQSDIDNIDKKIEQIMGVYGEELAKEEAKRTASTGTVPVVSDDADESPEPGQAGSTGGSSPKPDKFAKAKAEKERREAQARISKATGVRFGDDGEEELYGLKEFEEEMLQIEVDYNKARLEAKGLTDDEAIKITADYMEAQRKQAQYYDAEMAAQEEASAAERITQIKQEYADGKLSKEAYNLAMEQEEMEHLRRMVAITKEGTEERKKAEEDYTNKSLELAMKRRDETIKLTQEAERKAQEHDKEVEKTRLEVGGQSKGERETEYNERSGILKEAMGKSIGLALNEDDSDAQIEDIVNKYSQEFAKLNEEFSDVTGEAAKKSIKDSLEEAAEWLKSDGGKAFTGALDVVVNAMSSIFSQLTTMVQAELEIQEAAIERRYNKEVEAAEGNSYKVAKAEKKKEADLAAAKNAATSKMYKMQVIQAIAQTAQGAISAYSSAAAVPLVGYIIAPIAAATAVAAGMLQVAAIKKQQQAAEQQGYASGGFTKKGAVNEVAGVVHAGEWVASQALVNSPQARPLIDALDYAQRNNTMGALSPAAVSALMPARVQRPASTETVIVTQSEPRQGNEISSRVSDTLDKLSARLSEPFVTVNTVTGDKGIKKAQDEYDLLMRNKSPKN